ncbi:unnamed protein product [Dicrocoelium dendriticum]|nr:unnamed protein product [Dicrocoelium dendriticum]
MPVFMISQELATQIDLTLFPVPDNGSLTPYLHINSRCIIQTNQWSIAQLCIQLGQAYFVSAVKHLSFCICVRSSCLSTKPMRADLVKKFESLQALRKQTSQRSTKLRELHLKNEILTTALSVLPEEFDGADHLRSLRAHVQEEDHMLRPWRRKMSTSDGNRKESKVGCSTAPICRSDPPDQDPSYIHALSLQSGTLEWHLDRAIDSGEVALAERFSDQISEKRTHVTRSADYMNWTAAPQRCKKRKKPYWTFQPKERWEFKSNM